MLACDFSKQIVCACHCLSCVRTFQKKKKLFVTKMVEWFDFTCLACEKGVSIALLLI